MAIVVGDIAGRFDELMLLLKKCPDREVISVGDMIDRGPKSKEVVDWFMKNGKAIMGNHEHLAIDYLRNGENYYPNCCWFHNGGHPTLASFGGTIPEEVLTWIEFLPKYIKLDGGFFVSHSFVFPTLTLDEALDLGRDCDRDWWQADHNILWNRAEPIRRPELGFQIAGHNSQFGLRDWSDEYGRFALCIDDGKHKKLTAFDTETMEIYQQDYLP